MAAKKRWVGSSYRRGGRLKTRWGTTYTRPKSWRTPNIGGAVHTTADNGKLLGVEPEFQHHYSNDPRKASKKTKKKYSTWVKSHNRRRTRGVKRHRRILR